MSKNFGPLLLVAAILIGSSAAVRAANGSVTYAYDALGRIVSASYDTGVVILYTYDANGNRTQQVINVNIGTLCWNTLTGCTGGGATTWDGGLWH